MDWGDPRLIVLNCERHFHPGKKCCSGCLDDFRDRVESHLSNYAEHPKKDYVVAPLCCESGVMPAEDNQQELEIWEAALERKLNEDE